MRFISAMGAALALAYALSAHAQAAEPDCATFRPADLPEDTRILSSEFRAAQGGWAARCIVRAAITTSPRSTINIRVDLPLDEAWNGNLLHLGGGGADGMISQDHPWRMADLMRMLGPDAPSVGNYVLLGTDSGHQGLGPVPLLDMTWAIDNPDAVVNHGYTANHRTVWTGVAIAQQFYGHAPQYRYMVGQSNGGRQGLMAANRYPGDYHGILAIAPAISQEVFTASAVAMLRHIYSHPDNWLGADARNLFLTHQLARCDTDDGAADGIIAHFTNCAFDPAELLCPSGQPADPTRCLTVGQITSLNLLYATRRAPIVLSDDVGSYPGYGIGADEAELQHIFGNDFGARDGTTYNLVEAQVRALSSNPAATPMAHDPRDFAPNYQFFSTAIDTNTPDLAAFIAAGGKLIIWFGAGDMTVSYERTGQWVRQMEAALGKDTTETAVRMYVSPSLGHGMTGNGAADVSLLMPLRDWVEHGVAPEQPVAIRPASELWPLAISRPLCRYGYYPRYHGAGDPSDAVNFACVASMATNASAQSPTGASDSL